MSVFLNSVFVIADTELFVFVVAPNYSLPVGGVDYESDGTLLISGAGSADNGEFECTGTNSRGQSTKASTRLEFVRPNSEYSIVDTW